MTATDQTRFEFDTATHSESLGPGKWATEVSGGWDIGGMANGGFVMSLMVRAMLAEVSQPDPLAVTGHYLAPVVAGPAEVAIEILRTGRRHATAMAALSQEGRETVRLLGTFGDLSSGEGPEVSAGAPPEMPPVEECIGMPKQAGSFRPPPIAERMDLRVHPAHVGFALGSPPGEGVISGWARFADGRDPDVVSLPLFADAFPPAVFNVGVPLAWVPTLELSVQIRKRPAAGWLRAIFQTRFLRRGYLDEDGEVWDSEGELVALSRQLAAAPRPRRR